MRGIKPATSEIPVVFARRTVDVEEGGCFWRVDHRGRPVDATKRLYGQAFAIYALCEYHRASREPEPLAHALALFRTVNQRMRDRVHVWA